MTYIPEIRRGYRALMADLPEGCRLKVLDHIHRDRLQAITDARMKRLSWVQQLASLQHNNKIQLITWQRDCDCVEGYSSAILNVEELESYINRQLAYAEGPMTFSLASPLRKVDLPCSRDRILEAFEDGHPWSV